MKIAMIGHKRIPSREGGIEIVVEELATRMVEEGHIVHAYNRSGHHVSGKDYGLQETKPAKDYNGIRLITIPTLQNGKLNAIVYSFLATIRALFGKYDVIHYHAEGPCSMIWIPKIFGIRTVATIHGLDWQRAKWGGFATRFLKFGEKMAAKHADEVIVLSSNVQKYFMDTYQRETRYIPNGISKPDIKDASIIKDKYNLEKDSYLLFLARIVPEKGLHYLLEAFKNVKTEMKLVVAGGSSHSNEYMDQIKKMAKEDSRVIMTGFVQGQELDELYSNCYCYVLPSDIEGMPISLLEAMSYGNCCIVSDIEENMEVVRDKAISFNKGNVEDLTKKIVYAAENPKEIKKYKDEAADFILSSYKWKSVVERTLEVYSDKSKSVTVNP